MPRLLEAHLPEMHGAFWLCLFAALQGQTWFARHRRADLQRAEIPCPSAALAQNRLGRFEHRHFDSRSDRFSHLALVWRSAKAGVLDPFPGTGLFEADSPGREDAE